MREKVVFRSVRSRKGAITRRRARANGGEGRGARSRGGARIGGRKFPRTLTTSLVLSDRPPPARSYWSTTATTVAVFSGTSPSPPPVRGRGFLSVPPARPCHSPPSPTCPRRTRPPWNESTTVSSRTKSHTHTAQRKIVSNPILDDDDGGIFVIE